jgi:hypothetical protein
MTEFNAVEYEEILARLKPIIGGRAPELQSAIVAELTALWLVGHADLLRAGLFVRHMELIRNILPSVELEVFGAKGHPENEGLPKAGMIFTTDAILDALINSPKAGGK